MPRLARVTPGDLVYHVLNRTVAGLPLFRKEADYEPFERIMIDRLFHRGVATTRYNKHPNGRDDHNNLRALSALAVKWLTAGRRNSGDV